MDSDTWDQMENRVKARGAQYTDGDIIAEYHSYCAEKEKAKDELAKLAIEQKDKLERLKIEKPNDSWKAPKPQKLTR